MQHRFRFLATQGTNSEFWRIEEDELFHLKKVLRLHIGAELEVFDAKGIWGEGILSEINSQYALVRVVKVHQETLSSPKLGLALGALQQQTMADLIPCLVELGLDEIHVFLQEGTAKARLTEKTILRWNKIALSSLKQCKRTRMPVIKNWGSLKDCIANIDFDECYTLDPEAKLSLLDWKPEKQKSLILFLGSEKGFGKEENALMAQHKFQSVGLGNAILRSYTAAIASTSVLVLKRTSSSSRA
jgi:16S rRNA (uracil1498-N3)-methyltransferase